MSHPSHLIRRYRLLKITEAILLGSAAGLFVYTALQLTAAEVVWLPVLTALLGSVAWVVREGTFRKGTRDLAAHLNQQLPELEQSADLMWKEEDLGGLQQIQKAKVLQRWSVVGNNVSLPHKLGTSAVFFLAGLLLAGATAFLPKEGPLMGSNPIATTGGDAATNEKHRTVVRSISLTIVPPAYTRLNKVVQSTPAVVAPEGSSISWQIEFEGIIHNAAIVFSGRDSVKLSEQNGRFIHSRVPVGSGFYQLRWQDETGTRQSDFYRMDITQDAAPVSSITNLQQFTRLKWGERSAVDMNVQVRDDHGIRAAGIVATVAKGSGEGVKFREEHIRFASPITFSGNSVTAIGELNLVTLGMEPGDELYFYIEAEDNRQPVPNRSRTETYFIALQDTARYTMVDNEGLGVDLMPDYFRSQRQIIIDTEKLLKDKGRITQRQFNFTSNELGFDQKTLRLKYGEFLGEEEDSGINTVQQQDEEEETDQTVEEKFGHQHDTENEHNLVEEKDNKKKDPVSAFVHAHDDSETATFFEQSLRAKLKTALSVMWDAELHLRMFHPEQSLPYQYQALKLLKEISNDARIYVHRTGFDPPPLKEEKRLTGELKDWGAPFVQRGMREEDALGALGAAVVETEKHWSGQDAMTDAQRLVYRTAGPVWAALSLEQPALLPGLGLLRRLADGETLGHAQWSLLRTLLWKVMPQRPWAPTARSHTTHALDDAFLNELERHE